MKKIILGSIFFVFALALIVTPAFAAGGFDEFGYNDTARIFVGPADGVDRVLDGMVWGDPTYADDHLVMKWNKAWDECNDAGGTNSEVCTGAWTNNEWTGMMPNGSGETWHYKFVWVGPCGANGTELPDGGYCIWNNYAVILSQGTADGEHLWDVLAKPAGYGAY